MITKTLLLTLFLFMPPLAYCQTGSIKSQNNNICLSNKIDSIIGTQINVGIPGCAVGIVKDGKIVYKHTFGLANLDYRIQVTDSTVFNLASVSKQFTAFLVLLLEKEGKVSLNDTIQKYIPELKNFGYPITIRQLLHHTSGIPANDNLRMFAGLSLEMPWDSEDEFNMLQSYQKLNFKPNEEHLYSNGGYFLLSRVIEKASGKTFAQCIQEKIFEPLKMKNAAVYDTPGKIILNRAAGYRKSGESFVKTNTEGDAFCGSTNVYLSVNDFLKWATNLTTGTLGGSKLIDRIINPSDTLNNGDTINYTYGFFIGKYKGLKLVGHEGGTNGFRDYIGHFPETGLSVFIMANGETIDIVDLSKQIAELYMKDMLKNDTKIIHNEIVINKELYKEYTGNYIFPDGQILNFANENDTLKIIVPDGPKFNTYPEAENKFFLKDWDIQFTFVKDSNGKVNSISWTQNNKETNVVRFNDPKPLTQKDFDNYIGKYEIPELDVIYPLVLKDNQLVLVLPKSFRITNINKDMKLVHISGDKFGSLISSLEFKRNKDGNVTGFVISDIGRLRNIEFVKKN
jgi:CubicO group peptidase (beta-lactamase class C family)